MEEYNNTMIDNMNAFAAGYQPPSMEDQMMMLGAMPAGAGNQVLDEDTVEFWEEHIRKGGTAPNEPDVNYTKAYENVHGELPDYDTDKKTDNKNNNQQNITNVYNVTQPPADDGLMPAGYVDRGFDPVSDEESDQLGFTAPGRAQGLPLDYTNVDSPYYVGSEWSFADGGQPTLQDFTGSSRNPMMPVYKKGGDVVMTFNGQEYTERDLRRMKRKDPRMFEELMFRANTEKQKAIMNKINSMRVDTEGKEEVITYTDSGNVDWIENFKNDKEYQDAFYNEYVRYRQAKKKGPKDVLSKEEFIENYIKFQQQNRWMNENISQDDLSNPGWDRLHEYTPCPAGQEKNCVEIDGKKWLKGTEEKDPNWRYMQAMEEAGMDAFDKDMISHMQAGFIGGKILELDDNDKQQLYATGVDDQTITLNGQTFNISGDDGFYGNTTNRELQGTVNVTPAEEGVPCSNAAEMEAACTEAGGTWTPYVPAVTDADGNENNTCIRLQL